MLKRIKGIIPELLLLIALVVGTVTLLVSLTYHATEEEKPTAVTVAQAPVVEVAEAATEPVYDWEAEVQAKRDSGYYDALELLARVIHCENSNEVDGEPACWKTGSVAVNRLNDPDYPNTIEGVIRQPGQYDCLSKLYEEEPTDIEYEVAAELLNSGSVIPSNVVFAAEFYQGSGCFDEEGNTKYCYK